MLDTTVVVELGCLVAKPVGTYSGGDRAKLASIFIVGEINTESFCWWRNQQLKFLLVEKSAIKVFASGEIGNDRW